MTKRNISFSEFKAEFRKALQALRRAETNMATRFQALIALIRDAGFEPLFTTKANDLDKEQREQLNELRALAANVYRWPNERASAYWRNLKWRVAKELSGDTQAARSKAARKANKAKADKTKADKRKPDTPAPTERVLPERLVMDMALALAEALPHVPENVAAQIRDCLQALEKAGIIEK